MLVIFSGRRYDNYHIMTEKTRKQRSHDRILTAAGRRMRRDGLDGFSVAEVMADAGLTHGGFYAHFESKRALAAEALSRAAEDTRNMWFDRLDNVRGGESLKWLAGRYLRPRHRDRLDDSCLFAALAMDVARADPATRDAFTQALEKTVGQVADKLDVLPPEEARAQALVFISLCVGALNLARAVPDVDLSDDILRAVRQFAGALLSSHAELAEVSS